MHHHQLLTLSLLLAISCRSTATPPDRGAHPASITAPAPTTPDAGPLCLPLVSGCGCAYACAQAVRRTGAQTYEVSHFGQDSRLDTAQVERWCFDAQGHGSPFNQAIAPQGPCRQVFYDRTPCGGECIPSLQFLQCVMAEGRCRDVH